MPAVPEGSPASVDLSTLGGGAAEELVSRAAARLGATELSETTKDYVVQQLREAPVPARAVGLLLGAPELQRR